MTKKITKISDTEVEIEITFKETEIITKEQAEEKKIAFGKAIEEMDEILDLMSSK